jgi:hypothetical protein
VCWDLARARAVAGARPAIDRLILAGVEILVVAEELGRKKIIAGSFQASGNVGNRAQEGKCAVGKLDAVGDQIHSSKLPIADAIKGLSLLVEDELHRARILSIQVANIGLRG